MPVGNLPGWRQVFTDDFSTDVTVGGFPSNSAYRDRWGVYDDGAKDTAGKNGGPSRYYPSKVVSVQNGLANLDLHTENGTPMAAALLPALAGQRYGKYTIRFRSDPVAGFKTAWLLWPDSEVWPRDGEIDFPEGDLTGTISAFMHRQGASSGGDQDVFSTSTSYTSWHTASIEWTPNAVKFVLDDRTIGTSTERIPNTTMHWVIQTESNGDTSRPAARGNLQIDWVAMYSYAP
jgi:beta-glucanase (GH16 family)